MTGRDCCSRSKRRFYLSYAYRCFYEQITVADYLLEVWWEWLERQRCGRSITCSMANRIEEFGDPALISMPHGTNMAARYHKAEDINQAIMQLEGLWLFEKNNRGKKTSWQLSLIEHWCQIPVPGGDLHWKKCLLKAEKKPRDWDKIRVQIWDAARKRNLVF